MAMIRCDECESLLDGDWHEFWDTVKGLICQDCYEEYFDEDGELIEDE